jgi:hypothetical protein
MLSRLPDDDKRPARADSADKTIMSAGAAGSLSTSAHPTARRTGSRTDGQATMAAAANATTTRIGTRVGYLELILGLSSNVIIQAFLGGAELRPTCGPHQYSIFSQPQKIPRK